MNPSPTRHWPGSPHHPRIAHVNAVEILDDAPDDEIWHVQVAAGDVRVVSLDKLNDLFRFGVIDEKVFVWQPGMANWVSLASLLDVPEPDEPFHVLFSPGNVRLLTLDQLDQFYRNSIIDEGTLIWQSGMPEWQTLGKAAGIDEAVLPLRSVNQPPPRAAQPVVGAASSAPPRAAQPVVALVPSAPPVSFHIEPYQTTRRRGGGRWLLRLAIASATILALFRNDLIHSALQSTPLSANYDQAERSLFGGPVFGTTRAVERLVASRGGHLDPVRLPIAVTQFADEQKRESVRDRDRDQAPSTPPKDVSAQPTRGTSAASNATATVYSLSPPTAMAPTAAPPAQDVAATGKARARPSAPAHRPAATPARPAKKRASSSKPGVQSGGSYYDPLNAAL